MKKTFLGFLTGLMMTGMFSMTAFAAPVTYPDGTVFDAEYYAERYPDVKAVFGTDANLLYQHYVVFGKAEGRLAVKPAFQPTIKNAPTNENGWLAQLINNYRVEHDQWELNYQFELANAAAFRAKELAVDFSHTRPDDSECFTAFPDWTKYNAGDDETNDGVSSDSYHGELIVRGQNSPEGAFKVLMSTREDRDTMLKRYYNNIGVSHFVVNKPDGTTQDYWAVALAYRKK